MSDEQAASDGLPWYLTVVILIAVLVVAFIVVVDLLTVAAQL